MTATGLTGTAAGSAGALAVGALAIGAGAIGALAIGRLAIGRARIKHLRIDELEVGSLRVDRDLSAPPRSVPPRLDVATSKLSHVDLVVGSLDVSLPFYRELLGPLGWSDGGTIEGERGETVHYLSVAGLPASPRSASARRSRTPIRLPTTATRSASTTSASTFRRARSSTSAARGRAGGTDCEVLSETRRARLHAGLLRGLPRRPRRDQARAPAQTGLLGYRRPNEDPRLQRPALRRGPGRPPGRDERRRRRRDRRRRLRLGPQRPRADDRGAGRDREAGDPRARQQRDGGGAAGGRGRLGVGRRPARRRDRDRRDPSSSASEPGSPSRPGTGASTSPTSRRPRSSPASPPAPSSCSTRRPLGHCDQSSSGDHLGSPALAAAIEQKQPRLAVCGHIHEAWGERSTIGATEVANLGPSGTFFEL